jgi:hypothetical protein
MDESRALDTLRGILARPEFNRELAFDPWQAFWDALWEITLAFLDWLFSPVGEVVRGQRSWIDLAVLLVALAVIGGGIWYLIRAVRVYVVREGVVSAREASLRRERSEHLWREAHALAAAGQFAEATRALYLSALYTLEERRVLAVQDALTNHEHAARAARQRPDAGAAFAAVVRHYDRLRYGNYPVNAGSFGELERLVHHARTVGNGQFPDLNTGT